MILAFFLEFIVLFVGLFIVFDTMYYYTQKVNREGKPFSLKSDFKEDSFLYQFFDKFPRLFARYLYDRKSRFDEYGIVVFYGEQGCGKTMALSHYCQKVYCKYPSAIIGSNYGLLIQDFDIPDLKTILTKKHQNEKGENLPIIFCYDELNQWAHCREWQSLPKNVIGELAYQRKNKRLILGTAQSISQLDRQVRIQCASGEWRRVYTFFDFICLVVRFKPDFDEEGNARKKKFRGFYIFFQDEVLRYLYDTNRTIERIANNENLVPNIETTNTGQNETGKARRNGGKGPRKEK